MVRDEFQKRNSEPCHDLEHDKNSGSVVIRHENIAEDMKHEADQSDCSSKDSAVGSKPAKKTLRKTFTSLLSKIQLGKLTTDGSSVTDTDSNYENTTSNTLISI